MSNALYSLAVLPPMATFAQAVDAAPAPVPPAAPPPDGDVLSGMLGVVAVGLCVLAVWVIRRIIRPRKLWLADTPGRPNHLTPLHVLGLFAVNILFGGVAAGLPGPRWRLVGILASQALWLVLCLAVARRTFRHGLLRGLGLSLRHWLYDSLRGVLGYLATFPVCFFLAMGFTLLLSRWNPDIWNVRHPMLVLLDSLPNTWVWRALIAVSAVVLAPLVEEVFFRGLLQSMLRRYTGSPWMAVVITSLCFGLMHYPTPQYIPALVMLGISLGYNYERCGRLAAPILIHALFNGVQIAYLFAGLD